MVSRCGPLCLQSLTIFSLSHFFHSSSVVPSCKIREVLIEKSEFALVQRCDVKIEEHASFIVFTAPLVNQNDMSLFLPTVPWSRNGPLAVVLMLLVSTAPPAERQQAYSSSRIIFPVPSAFREIWEPLEDKTPTELSRMKIAKGFLWKVRQVFDPLQQELARKVRTTWYLVQVAGSLLPFTFCK